MSHKIMTDRERLDTALTKMMHDTGYEYRAKFWCCQTCAHAGFQNEGIEEFVFFHEQSDDAAFSDGSFDAGAFVDRPFWMDEDDDYEDEPEDTPNGDTLTGDLYLHHSGGRAPVAAVKYLREYGFKVEWDGTDGMAVIVQPWRSE